MITEEEALQQILADAEALFSRRLSPAEALNCFAAEDCVARVPLPNFDNSAMDGYAVIASDCRPGSRLEVVGEQPAGTDQRLQLKSAQAIRIFTGAPMPAGADAVVMQEDVHGDAGHIVVNTNVQPGEFVRRRGCDLAVGQKILGKGGRLRDVVVGVLAAQGFTEVSVGGEVRVAIVSTGNELVQPGQALEPGQIYDSNSSLLRGLVTNCGATVASVEHARDEHEALLAKLRQGIQSDVMLISGGVSVGEHDLVKSVLAEIGAKLQIWRVAIKPGKPFLFGRAGGCRIFGLPGNPVSSFVTFLKFVRPAILKMMGAGSEELAPRLFRARLTENIAGDTSRPHYIRGWLAGGDFTPTGRQESHALYGLSRSNALLRVGSGAAFQAGELVDIEIWE
jgi:molybdopterin molybdotransferase